MTPEEALAIVLDAFKYHGMTQAGYEARDLALFCAEHGVADVMELGTKFGGSLYLLDRACKPGIRISVDDSWETRDLGNERIEELKALFYQNLGHVKEIWGNIHDESTRLAVEQYLAGRQVDLIFADADHSYHGSKAHFVMYSPFIRRGGYFAVHDVANGHPCQQWWEQEMVPRYETWLFAEEVNRYGIGVARVP